MYSSSSCTNEYQSDEDPYRLSNLISSTPINPSSTNYTTNTQSILAQALPAPLSAPVGWRSEIIQSNSPIPTNNETDFTNANNTYETNFDGFNTTNNNFEEYNTFNSSTEQTQFINNNNNNAFINTSSGASSIHEQQQQQQEQHMINNINHQQPPPLIVRKTLPNNIVTYQQNVSIRYLQPPTPPPSGPIIIREVRPPQPPPPPPLQVRQRPPAPPTPPPLVLREKPPPIPYRASAKVVERLLPALPQPPRRVIVERYPSCPPKPSDVVIERWLPYKQSDRRRILVERAPAPCIPRQEPNLLILHDQPHARVHKQFINQGVVRADPDSYLQRYGSELNSGSGSSHLIDEATRAIPPPLGASSDHHYHTSYTDEHRRASSPYISSNWDRTRLVSPLPRSSSYHYGSSYYDSPYSYCGRSSYGSGLDYYHHSDDNYPARYGSYETMTDVTPSWDRYCGSSSRDRYCRSPSWDRYYTSRRDRYCLSPSYYSHCSSYPNTIRVKSENEFHHVLSDLTNGHGASSFRSY